ncbi:hypothetical protein PO909_015922 [Leuciscus waleckii]
MPIARLRSRLNDLCGRVPSSAPRSTSSTRAGTSAGGQGDLRVTVWNKAPTVPRSTPPSSTVQPVSVPNEPAVQSTDLPQVSFGAPEEDVMSIAASQGGQESLGSDDSAVLPPSGVPALPESDPELTAMLSRAAAAIGLEWSPPPGPVRSRLDDWFLGAAADPRRRPTPMPFFPDVHEEVTRRPPKGTLGFRGDPKHPSKACRFSSTLVGKAYRAAGLAATSLHAMATLQVYQAQMLRDMHEGRSDPALSDELRAATDLALRATKVTARSLGQVMSTCVVQERHLWLNLSDMREAERTQFLDTPIFQAGLFGGAVEDFAQQFSTAQKQTEALKHVLPRRPAASAAQSSAQVPQSARRRGRPPAAPAPPDRPQQPAAPGPRRGVSRRKAPQPSPARALNARLSGAPETDCSEMVSSSFQETVAGPLLPPMEGWGRILGCPTPAARPTTGSTLMWLKKELTSPSLSTQSSRMTVRAAYEPRHSRPPLSPDPCQSTPSWDAGPPLASSGRMRLMTVPPHRAAMPPSPGPVIPPRCTTEGTSVVRMTPLVQSLGAWLELPGLSRWVARTIRLGYAIQFAWSPPRFRGVRFTMVGGNAPVMRAEVATLLAKDAIETVPPAEMKSGFYSPYFIVPKKSGGFYSLTEGTLGTDSLAHSWPRGLRKYAFPPVSLLAQTLRKIREDEEQVILVAPYWHNRTWFPELVLLATAPPWPIPLRKDLLSQGRGTLWHHRPDLWNLHVWLLDETSVVLSFLQEGLERRLSPSTLKVYVAAIAAHHDAVDGKSLGKHDLIVRFLRGARGLNPPRPPLVPSWDLSVVLTALQSAPFEPLQSVELKFLSMKTALLVALASIKRVGDLQAFSVEEACLEFGPANSHVILRPRPGYVPKVPTTPFRDQVVNLQSAALVGGRPSLGTALSSTRPPCLR